MKILIVNTLYHPYKVGGAEVSVQLLAEGLVAKGNTVRVVSLHDKETTKMDVVNGVEVSYLPLFNKYWPYSNYMPTKIEKMIWHLVDTYNIVMAKKVEREILQFQPDIVHTNNLAGFSVAVWDVVKKHNIKLVHTSRDYYLFHPNSTLFKRNKVQSPTCLEVKLYSLVKKLCSRNVDYYVGISDFIKNIHVNNGFFDKQKCQYIYNPINFIEKTEYNTGKIKIGFIGRLTKDKGFDDFCNLAKKYKDEFDFIAAGKFSVGSEGEKFKELAVKLNIHLLGFVKIDDFINYIDIVCLPVKWNEPFGRVVVECASAGVPVYTNKKGGISELFKYFNNIKEFNFDCSFEINTINSEGLELQYDKFSPDTIAKQYTTLFSRILEC
ncbi:glycosyltransferase family 4 protein [Acinetobacter variabilis]|uniref:glycosyltransferase family 4 protein n=1 Tax=Acinetobacter variabilis TaxID=70346 RepID=UPI0028A99514|nr:glycosyltransferase family 4 protein [Acinetobacter variabilis]